MAKLCLSCHTPLKFTKKDYCYACVTQINSPTQKTFSNWYKALLEKRSQIGLKYGDMNDTELHTAFDMVYDKQLLITDKAELFKLKQMDFAEAMQSAWNQGIMPDYFDECCDKIRESNDFQASQLNGLNFIKDNMPYLSESPTFKKYEQSFNTIASSEVPF